MSLLDLDNRITFWLYSADRFDPIWQQLLFFTASVIIYSLPVLLLVLFFRSARDRLNSVKMAASALLAWLVFNKAISAFLYGQYHFRDRPFASQGLEEFLFEQPPKAFPSDHAAVLAAVVLTFFYYRYPKLGSALLIAGLVSSLSRVVIGFHYFGDVLAGWLVGAAAFGVIYLLDRPLTTFYHRLTRTPPQ